MNVMVLFFDFGLQKSVKNPVVIEIRLEPRASNWLAALPPEFCKLYDEKAWYRYVIFFQNTRAMTASDVNLHGNIQDVQTFPNFNTGTFEIFSNGR